MVCRTVGLIVLLEAGLFLLPLIVSLIYRETCTSSILCSIAIALAIGLFMVLIARPRTRVIYAKEGFAITTFAWLFLSAIGALPFFLSGQIPHYIDAFFETVSGFTTTGASILTNVEKMEKGLLFWRSFTHWVGGMGVLVFLVAFLKGLPDRSIHILRAEMPGPTMGKLMPKLKDTAKALYLIYLAMTAIQVVFLLVGGMNLFDSLLYTFGTAGTGGFGIYADSCASFTPYQIWVITIFMFLFGVNFNIYYFFLMKKIKAALSSTELWTYFGIMLSAVVIVCINISGLYSSFSDSLKHAAFQVSSIMTTTGFSSTDFNLWPNLSKTVLLILMFIGACAGSTAGGFKVSRLILIVKNCVAEIRHMIHPRSVTVIRYEGKAVDGETRKQVNSYLSLYVLCFFTIFLLISIDGFDIETNLSAVAACFNNIGPGLGLVGPLSSYAEYSYFSKIMLSLAMLLGRLELWPILLALLPGAWKGWRS